jgi:hypothetical protein
VYQQFISGLAAIYQLFYVSSVLSAFYQRFISGLSAVYLSAVYQQFISGLSAVFISGFATIGILFQEYSR